MSSLSIRSINACLATFFRIERKYSYFARLYLIRSPLKTIYEKKERKKKKNHTFANPNIPKIEDYVIDSLAFFSSYFSLWVSRLLQLSFKYLSILYMCMRYTYIYSYTYTCFLFAFYSLSKQNIVQYQASRVESSRDGVLLRIVCG